MADETLRVLIVEDNEAEGRSLRRMIDAETDMETVDVVPTGQEGVRRAAELRPDIVLMNVYLPDIDGFQATTAILAANPRCAVVMVTVESRTEFLQQAMALGALGYVLKPVRNPQVLTDTVRTAHRRVATRPRPTDAGEQEASALAGPSLSLGRRIAFYSPKGGQGKTTVAVNLAVALRQLTEREVVIFDADLQFGNAHMLLDLACQKSIFDLVRHIDQLDSTIMDQVLGQHASGVKVLMRPSHPEDSDRITPDHVQRVLSVMSLLYDYVVVDCEAAYGDRLFAALDHADQIVLVLQPDLGAVMNVERFLERTDKLGYPRRKLVVVLNRANTQVGITTRDIEARLGAPTVFRLDSLGAALTTGINLGRPVVLTQPRSGFAQVMHELAEYVRRAPVGAA